MGPARTLPFPAIQQHPFPQPVQALRVALHQVVELPVERAVAVLAQHDQQVLFGLEDADVALPVGAVLIGGQPNLERIAQRCQNVIRVAFARVGSLLHHMRHVVAVLRAGSGDGGGRSEAKRLLEAQRVRRQSAAASGYLRRSRMRSAGSSA